MKPEHERVLVLAFTKKDGESTSEILGRAGISSFVVDSPEQLGAEIENGAGALLIAKETLSPSSIEMLAQLLKSQPTWSFLPVVILISTGDLAAGKAETLRFLKPLPNTTLLERPVRVSTLVSVFQAALADRSRQYKLRDMLESVEASKREAVEANKAKSSFLANMSHEIRTPLGAILGFSELLMEPKIESHEKETFMQTIKRNGELLSALINDILDLAKVEAGHLTIESIEVSFHELVAEVVAALEPRASSKGVRLNVEWKGRVPRSVRTDPVRFKQILLNVIGNAVKFTDKGSIRVSVSSVTKGSAAELDIVVSDTGLGITTEQAENLFQPFTQADNSITRKYGGTGLGLVLSRQLARALGGDLTLRESSTSGSTFVIRIVAEVPNPSSVMASAQLDARSDDRILETGRILLVDDSLDNQMLISRMLRLSGASVETASDGFEGVEKALSGEFDVVLMDIQMPRLDGHQATKTLRKRGFTKPVIALTAHALDDDREKCFAAGCSGYLTKPVHRAKLIDTISAFLKPESRAL